MLLRGQKWGPVFNSSGARGFFGEGYWFHRPWRRLGLDYSGSDFVAKTTTLYPRSGNMPLLDDRTTPRDLFPKCVVVKPIKGVVLNSVGLSGPGARRLINKWGYILNGYRIKKMLVSFMSVEPTMRQRLEEAREFVELFGAFVELFGAFVESGEARAWDTSVLKVGVQVNFSCPNVGLDTDALVREMSQVLDLFRPLEVPVLAKMSVTMDPTIVAKAAQDHPGCDGVVCSNTVPWGHLSHLIDWRGLFGSEGSPLEGLGGGGLSGKPLLPLVREWIRKARDAGLTKPIIGCGGVLSMQDADQLINAGADGIELGSVSILRPWRVQGIIRHVNERLGQ